MLIINAEANWDFMIEINGNNNIEKYFMLINLDLFFDENFFFSKSLMFLKESCFDTFIFNSIKFFKG